MPAITSTMQQAGIRSRHELKAWGLALLAMMPMLLIYTLHFSIVSDGFSATGFLQYDQASYMADGQAYFSHGFSMTYGLPFSPNDATPQIYFQPLTFLLGLLVYLTHLKLGYVYDGAGVLAGIAMFRVAIALAEQIKGPPRDLAGWLAWVAFLWGGGVIAVSGLLLVWLPGLGHGHVWLPDALLAFDAQDGWWFLNVGRNVYFTTEAFYHVLFFATVLLVLRRRYGLAAAAVAFTSATHPFTGFELIAVVGGFAAIEYVTKRPSAPPLWFIATLAVLLAAHLGYYLVALRSLSPEHLSVEQQYSLNWALSRDNILAAYGPVMLLAAVQLLWFSKGWAGASRPEVRFLVVWFAIAFILANHEMLVAPRQPLHFTRGYVWAPLALLSLPLVERGFRWALNRRSKTCLVAMLSLAILDNAAFFGRQYVLMAGHRDHQSLLISDDAKATLARLSQPDLQAHLLLANDEYLGYLTTVYLPLRTWLSHRANTPDAERRRSELQAFFATGEEVPAWRSRPLVVAANTEADPGAVERLTAAGFSHLDTFGRYELLVREAR